VPATVVDAVTSPFPCACNCYDQLTLDQRAEGIAALYRFDDAMRGWGQTVIWDLAASKLFLIQRQLGEVKWVAVRDTGCIYARLVGFCVHELIHAVNGDPRAANYGVPLGVPYGVPAALPIADEAAFLLRYNEHEARAWAGLAHVAYRLFGIAWEIYPAREIGTYGFVGGDAICDVPAGYRPVPHYDRTLHPRRYAALGQKLEDDARAWFTAERLDAIAAQFEAAEAIGRAQRPREFPHPREVARHKPRVPGRNDLCMCGSMKKYKQCCGARAE